ncbi:MAG: hypothetical protein Q4C96_10725 [Planctomycetia bacterium]|nr:hypothetical protein [Planctomycetia bacterium]
MMAPHILYGRMFLFLMTFFVSLNASGFPFSYNFCICALYAQEKLSENSPENSPEKSQPTIKRMIETFQTMKERFQKDGMTHTVQVLEEKIALAKELDGVITAQVELSIQKDKIQVRIRQLEVNMQENDPLARDEMREMEEALAKVNTCLQDAKKAAQMLLGKLQSLSLAAAIQKDKDAEKEKN